MIRFQYHFLTMILKDIISFHQKSGVNFFFDEITTAMAGFINHYLESGDEWFLHQKYQVFGTTLSKNLDDYLFWKKLRLYNRSFPQNQQIKVIGVDIESQPIVALISIILDLRERTTQ